MLKAYKAYWENASLKFLLYLQSIDQTNYAFSNDEQGRQ